jgi:hypothetical protein
LNIHLRSKSQWNLYSRYQNIGNDKRDYLRGFGYQGGASRGLCKVAELAFGGDFKDTMSLPADTWSMGLGGFGEMLPYENKFISIIPKKTNGVNLF